MSFAAPGLLVFLLLVPAALVAYLMFERRRTASAASWAAPALLENMVVPPPRWRRHLPVALMLAGLTLLLVGFARPKATHTVSRQDATVVLLIDVSGSMASTDVSPSRLAVARYAALRFVDRLPHGYQVAVVLFSDHTAVVSPPTQDLARVRAVIEGARTGPQGTALGEAVWHSIDVAESVPKTSNGKKPPAVVMVFSDGGLDAGQISPTQAIAKAQREGIPISTLAIGTPSGIVKQPLKGGLQEQIQVPVQPIYLQELAKQTKGRFFSSVASLDVGAVYRQLGSRVGKVRRPVEITAAAAGGGIAFMLVGATLSGLWFRRLT